MNTDKNSSFAYPCSSVFIRGQFCFCISWPPQTAGDDPLVEIGVRQEADHPSGAARQQLLPRALQLFFEVGRRWMRLREHGVGAHQDDVVVAGFEAFEFPQGGVEGTAGGVNAVLEPGERLVALLKGIGASGVGRAGGVEILPEGIFDPGEAAQVPLALDDLIEEASRLGGSGRMAGVVFVK